MTLTIAQEQGLRIAVQRYRDHEPWTCIAGYAGTGKSTLVKFIISALELDPEQVAYVAYTGKAAMVLKEKGCPNATTAHKLLYNSYPRKDGTFFHMPKRPLDKKYSLIVVDEISMLPKELWELLLTHQVYVIALGDPGQLPPIGEDNGVLANPHVFLDEIMRQAQESEIIRLTMDIRAGKPLVPSKGQEVMIVEPCDVSDSMILWADQVIVGKNITRQNMNYRMRKLILNTESESPVVGDRVICLRNDWNTITGGNDVLVNGLIGTIQKTRVEEHLPWIDKRVVADFMPAGETDADHLFCDLTMDYKLFAEHEPTINARNFTKVPKFLRPHEFDYGYCITCHKAQGSEYDKVLVFEEYLKGDEHQRWLYTAATRAAKKLVIVKDYR